MFAKIINNVVKAFAKETNNEARIAKWMKRREELIAMRFRLVEHSDMLREVTYKRGMKSIKHRIARVNHLLNMVGVAA